MTNTTGPSTRWGRAGGRQLPWALGPLGRALGLAVVVLGGASCSLSDEVPPDVTDPAITRTPAGALNAYRGTVAGFRDAFGGSAGARVVDMGGLLSDELQVGEELGLSNPAPYPTVVDRRTFPDGFELSGNKQDAFGLLQQVRGQASQAIGLLTRYAPEQRALVGHAYALAGYAEVFLAELYCSGIPLSTLDFEGDYTPKPGSTTREVLTHAAALFDTALTLVGDSARFVHLAAVGKGRALLGRGDYAAAVAAVAAVPDAYRYEMSYVAITGDAEANFVFQEQFRLWNYSVADHEGGNGLDYRTSGDPRTPVTLQETNGQGYPVYFPANYATDGSSSLVLASGVEARLIAAEAALQANPTDGTWLTTLNTLRTDGTQAGGVYQPGTGGVAGLAPLTDPGTPDARVDLLFRERAFWLFLTGHRQGDLRRLIRQYGRVHQQIYPVGAYPGSASPYGDAVTLPVPRQEQITNPLYTGCASRGA